MSKWGGKPYQTCTKPLIFHQSLLPYGEHNQSTKLNKWSLVQDVSWQPHMPLLAKTSTLNKWQDQTEWNEWSRTEYEMIPNQYGNALKAAIYAKTEHASSRQEESRRQKHAYLTIVQLYNEGMIHFHQNISLHLCANPVPHCQWDQDVLPLGLFHKATGQHQSNSLIIKANSPFNDAFLRTFIAYSWPASGPIIFLTKNTLDEEHVGWLIQLALTAKTV